MGEDSFSEYNDISIDVYDIEAFVDAETDGQFEAFDFRGGAAILIKPDGSGCMVDFEAVGYDFKSIDDSIELGICKHPEKHEGYTTISIIPTHCIDCTYRDIMDNAPVQEMTVGEFFTKKNYNSRCASNFKGILEFFEG